jgi:peptidoglycan hydrolase-like protein with peptidoglycan-binding domain
MSIQPPVLRHRASVIATTAAVFLAMMAVAGRADAASSSRTPVLAQGIGMHAKPSVRVRRVQQALQQRGYDLGPAGVDGRFGPRTDAAVRRLQARRGLAVDGIVGKRTRAALRLGRRHAATSERAQKPAAATPSSSSAPAPAKPSAAPSATTSSPATPNTITVLNPASDKSTGTFWKVLFWAAVGALAAFGLAWLLRRVRRGPDTEIEPPTEPGVLPVAVHRTGPREPMIGYLATASGSWSADHERSASAIEAACERSAWELLDIVWERENGRALERPGLRHACERIARGQARGLVVSDLQRLSRSEQEMGAFMAFFRDADARLVGLDIDLDTSTPGGRYFADRLIAQTVGTEDTTNGRAAVAIARGEGGRA